MKKEIINQKINESIINSKIRRDSMITAIKMGLTTFKEYQEHLVSVVNKETKLINKLVNKIEK